MIFIGLFAFIVFIIVGLNMYDDYNLKKIENYIIKAKCEKYVYSKGSYKALCDNKLIQIANSFNVDIKTQKKEFNYKDIKEIQMDINRNTKSIIINKNEKLFFSTEEELKTFYKKLQEKIK